MAVSPGCDYSKVLELIVESNQLIKNDTSLVNKGCAAK